MVTLYSSALLITYPYIVAFHERRSDGNILKRQSMG